MRELVRKSLAEAYGTFALVFAGTGAIIIDDVTGGTITHLGVALTFGLIVTAMIYAVGATSGAHINPAVTLGFVSVSRMSWPLASAYIGAQFVGACAASIALRALFTEHATLGLTAPSGSAAQSFVLEIILTALLMFVILAVTSAARDVQRLAGFVVGGTVGLAALFAGPICGASMNPARSLGPALVAGEVSDLWIYLSAPVLGALLGCALWRSLQPAPASELELTPPPRPSAPPAKRRARVEQR